jgi:dUTP pyrophosphatase
MIESSIELKIINKLLYKDSMINYATEGSAGIDLYAALEKDIFIYPNSVELIPSGIAIYIKDKNLAGLIVPRSGIGHKYGIVLGNLIGIIDSDYQGEIKISCWNRSNKMYLVKPKDKICQLIIVPIVKVKFNIVSEFNEETKRGISGYGSTGK